MKKKIILWVFAIFLFLLFAGNVNAWAKAEYTATAPENSNYCQYRLFTPDGEKSFTLYRTEDNKVLWKSDYSSKINVKSSQLQDNNGGLPFWPLENMKWKNCSYVISLTYSESKNEWRVRGGSSENDLKDYIPRALQGLVTDEYLLLINNSVDTTPYYTPPTTPPSGITLEACTAAGGIPVTTTENCPNGYVPDSTISGYGTCCKWNENTTGDIGKGACFYAVAGAPIAADPSDKVPFSYVTYFVLYNLNSSSSPKLGVSYEENLDNVKTVLAMNDGTTRNKINEIISKRDFFDANGNCKPLGEIYAGCRKARPELDETCQFTFLEQFQSTEPDPVKDVALLNSKFVGCSSDLSENALKLCCEREVPLARNFLDACLNIYGKYGYTGDCEKLLSDGRYDSTKKACELDNGFDCSDLEGDLLDTINDVFRIVQFAGFILVVILSMVDFFKAVGENEQESIKKAGQKVVKRVIALAILLLLPVVINTIFALLPLDKTPAGEYDVLCNMLK